MEFMLSTSKIFSHLLVFLLLNCLTSYAQWLPEEEVRTLETISTKLNIGKYWNISRTFCSQSSRLHPTLNIKSRSNFTCDCSENNNTVCHVIRIWLRLLNLTGVLPDEFGDLTYLQHIDLSLNYINGSIPASLAQLPLVTLNLWGNRISGTIPKEIGGIATLESLILENNQLGGPLPENLGNLSNLSTLHLSGNNFNGSIPETFGNFKNLTEFRIDGNPLSGKIPDFIGNWAKITLLHMRGTSMEGPIPSTISLLKNLEYLRISDLSGLSSTEFPNLQDMKNLLALVLRNCLIIGSIPEYIGELTKLEVLDLSFNRLTGQIPTSLEGLNRNNFRYFDVSYNNFSGSSTSPGCQSTIVNLVSSYPSLEKNNSVDWCLRKDLPCPSTPQFLGASNFVASRTKWAYSRTGLETINAIEKNTFYPNATGYYETARLAPTSLKYYGLCLQRGSYRVQLHFAEIMFSDDQTDTSLGRRIFDVSIQGNVVLKDFNIAEKAKGVGKGITEDFPNILVEGSTLEIHLYWSGKGTTSIPVRGLSFFGPLISAITVTPRLSVGVTVGIVAASCVLLVLILVFLRMKGFLGGKDLEDKELRGLIELQTGYFTLSQIKAATSNFDPANKIGEGGFGPVYKV